MPSVICDPGPLSHRVGALKEEVNFGKMMMKFLGILLEWGILMERDCHTGQSMRKKVNFRLESLPQKLKIKEATFWTSLRAMEVEKAVKGETEK